MWGTLWMPHIHFGIHVALIGRTNGWSPGTSQKRNVPSEIREHWIAFTFFFFQLVFKRLRAWNFSHYTNQTDAITVPMLLGRYITGGSHTFHCPLPFINLSNDTVLSSRREISGYGYVRPQWEVKFHDKEFRASYGLSTTVKVLTLAT